MTRSTLAHGTVTTTPRGRSTTRTSRTLRIAGGTYVAAWLVGLTIAPAAPKQTAPAAEVHSYYVQHTGAIVLQSLLVHGLAGVALLVMAVTMARALAGTGRAATWIRATGCAAALVSLAQVAIALAACDHAGDQAASTSKALFTALNYADTTKLLLIAAFAATVTWAADRTGVSSRMLHLLGRVLPPLLVVGGLAFLIDSTALFLVLACSLLVLLIWAAVASWRIGRAAPTS